ncbi:hypothetical protein OHA91_10755 [Streptomyces erythrochromogenes]|uniref:Uncharacterized protein n=2 Tax=Streptomyces erythrochromogenes TaxID=285574 RepID=A0ABZ1Q8C6_9ACTN|nr:hypothetical protein [Streptomyces erythrochromogenes]
MSPAGGPEAAWTSRSHGTGSASRPGENADLLVAPPESLPDVQEPYDTHFTRSDP